MRAYFWYAFVPGAVSTRLDCFGGYWGQNPVGFCFEVLAGPEMAPYPDAPGQGADDIPF